MSFLRVFVSRIGGLFRKDRFERDLDEELRTHLDMLAEENIRSGMNPEEARYSARRSLGGVERTKEQYRDARGIPFLEDSWKDLCYGARMLGRNRAFTAIALLTLALGIGANSAIFSVVNAVLLRPLPYQDADRLVMLWTDDPGRAIREGATSFVTFHDWRTQSSHFADMAIFSDNPVTLTGLNEPERVKGEFVSSNLFPLLGVEPVFGRTFSQEEEDRSADVVVLSYGLWQRRFGGRPDVIGQPLKVDGDANSLKGAPRIRRIIGVMPPGFYFPDKQAQLWEPATAYWRWKRETQADARFWARRCNVIGRLKPNVTVLEAQAEMTAIGQSLSQAYPVPPAVQGFPGFAVNVVPLLDQVTGKKLQVALWVLLGAVGFVLLTACVNVANLSLARGAAREREFAIRAALGAGRGRLLRQLLTESALLTLGGAALGLGLAGAGVGTLAAFAPPGIPRLDEVRIDTQVLVFTVGVSLLAGLLFGLVPAWKVSRSDPNDSLKEGSSSASAGVRLREMRGLLVVAECALAVVLLIGAGLLIHSFLRLQAVDPGFKPEGVLLVRVSLPPAAQKGPGEARLAQRIEIFHQFADRIAGVAGVQRVGAISNLLLRGTADESIRVKGRPAAADGQEPVQLAAEGIDAGFFETMGVPLLRGRLFTPADLEAGARILFAFGHASTPPEAVIVNEAFARRFFPGEDPIGKVLIYSSKDYQYEIVGVVGDMRRQGLEKEAIPEYFVPFKSDSADLVVRVSSEPLELATTIRQAIGSVEKGAMILSISTLEGQMGELTAQRRFQTLLLALFSAVALVLAMIGIYGIVHYSVAQRKHEIGIRIALGARTADVMRLVIGQGMKLAGAGVATGLLGALWLTDVMSNLLYGVSTRDPATFGAVALLLLGVALAACYLPARKAAKVDPLVALRYE